MDDFYGHSPSLTNTMTNLKKAKLDMKNSQMCYDNHNESVNIDTPNQHDLNSTVLNNNSIIILLNNSSFEPVRGSIARNNGGYSENNDISQETIIPSLNKDPPITLEEAMFLVSGEPDKYAIYNIFIVNNMLSMLGFMFFLSAIFLF